MQPSHELTWLAELTIYSMEILTGLKFITWTYNLFQNKKSTTCSIMLAEKKKSLE
jgi:hypothetical protein